MWEKKTLPETRRVQQAVIEIITSSDTPDEIINEAWLILMLYKIKT